MSIRTYDPLAIARQFLFVREVTGNHGQRVNAIQSWSGGGDGDSWCCEFATMVLDLCYQGHSPLPRMASCEDVHQFAIAKGWVTTTPVPGDLYLRTTDGHAHHIGFVTQFAFGQGHFGSISGNTNDTGSSDGDGVYEHDVIALGGDVFIHIPEGV